WRGGRNGGALLKAGPIELKSVANAIVFDSVRREFESDASRKQGSRSYPSRSICPKSFAESREAAVEAEISRHSLAGGLAHAASPLAVKEQSRHGIHIFV